MNALDEMQSAAGPQPIESRAPVIRNAHAYMADGILVVEWGRPDGSGVLLMIDKESATFLSKKPGENYGQNHEVGFKVADGWPAELIEQVDIDAADAEADAQ
jgi:hypothetical protein